MDIKTYESFGLHTSLSDNDPTRVVNGRANREIMQSLSVPGDRQYNPCPEAAVAEGVARGTVTLHPRLGRLPDLAGHQAQSVDLHPGRFRSRRPRRRP